MSNWQLASFWSSLRNGHASDTDSAVRSGADAQAYLTPCCGCW